MSSDAIADPPPVPAAAIIRRAPRPPKPKKKTGRKPKAITCDRCELHFASRTEYREHECANARPPGRPPKTPLTPQPLPCPPIQTPIPPVPMPSTIPTPPDIAPPAPQRQPPVITSDPPHSKGYTRIYVDEHGAELAVPITEETETRRQVKTAPAPAAPCVEVALPADLDQQKLVDELGELDRRRQLHAADDARFETLKKAVKSWFDTAPPDADGLIEGQLYRLHISARERERRIRDLHEVTERIGLDQTLQIATIPIAELSKILGVAEVDALLIETRSGSRRIRCIPKFPAAAD